MIESVRDGVYVRTSHMQQLQSVMVIDDGGVYLFDPCYFDDEIREIRSFVAPYQHGRELNLILTHSDFDHIAGVPYFAPEYGVWGASTWDTDNEQRAAAKIELFDSQYYVNRPWHGVLNRIQFARHFADGESYQDVHFVHAKGHTNDGLVTIKNHVAVVGDYLSALEFPFIYTSYYDYCATLKGLRGVFVQHQVNLVIPQHGPYAEGSAEVERRFAIAEDYLAALETTVREGLQQGRAVDDVANVSAQVLTFDGQPLAKGITSFHKSNVRILWRELSPQHT
ncbi:MBL fold metallo-hydrolase [Alicyclobacillus sp. ALC3]|uniref:MBL fold metallo-hydrolase n=1 Tax=Alicyclobacillus sp. ALC3 TaxID=2796143 RepID=UPI002378DE78|nr:MBL fold metallo-hydrolase [Alicyclobacillus sp. ALC3]WDL95966.1 MBL fold metallo-hydrolase [Alicyclobacillus sp. ALC3]